MAIYIHIYMVQYAIIHHFCQKFGKNRILKKLYIFKSMHQIITYTSQNVHRTMKEQDFRKYGVQGVPKNQKKGRTFREIIKNLKTHNFCCFISRLLKKLQKMSFCHRIEDILPFVLNTKQPPSDIWLLSYEQNSLGVFLNK